MEKFKLIKKPKGGGSSIKDFTFESENFRIHKGTYGGIKCTIVSFNVENSLDFYFEGILNFKNKNEVFTQLMLNNIKISTILKQINEKSYSKGFFAGEQSIQKQFKQLLGM